MTIKERVDQISQNIDLNLKQFPTSAKIEISGKCSLSCNFCYQNKMKSQHIRQKIMSNNVFDKVLSFIQTIPTLKEVGLFYMGESGLDNNLAQKYKIIKNLGYFTYLTTNGTIKQSILDAIPYIDSLKVSWNYRDVSDFVAKTNSTEKAFYQIVANIAAFANRCHLYQKELTVSTIVDTCKDDYINSLKLLSFDQHYWLPLQTQYDVNMNGVGSVVGQYDNQSSQIPCWSLFKCLYIDVNGDVRQCCYGHTDDHVLYNIYSVRSFYLPQKLLDLRRQQLDGTIPNICKRCQ